MTTVPQNSMRMLLLALGGTLLVLALFLFFAANASPKGAAMPPQPDTLIYMQYARAMAEGHPYCYLPGSTPTTASTSHLYPVLLAIPYALGAQGEALYVVSLLYNIVFLLLIVALVWCIARRMAPEAAGYAACFAACSGPLAYTVLQQSDIGLFTVLLLAFFASLLYERHKTAGLFLALTVWCRPEGFILAAATLGYGIVARWHPQRRRICGLGLWGCGNVMAVLLLNKLLTGAFLFQSLAGKGYLAQFSFTGALVRMAEDCGSLGAGFLLGLDHHSDRYLYTLPLIGGLLALAGLVGRLRHTEDCTTAADGCWALGTLGALVVLASSGWQGFNHDRHIGWLFAFLAIYMAAGLQLVKKALPRSRLWHGIGLTVVLYQALALSHFAFENAKSLKITALRMSFVSEAQRLLPPDKSIITTWFFSAAYLMPGRSFFCANGYITPQFVTRRDRLTNIEVLRRHPELRADYWLMDSCPITDDWRTDEPLGVLFRGRKIWVKDVSFPIADEPLSALFFGRQTRFLIASKSDLALYEADWSSLDAPRTPLATNSIAALQGWQKVDELDVGYVPDEKTHDYQTISRLSGWQRLPVFADTRTLDGRRITEAARMAIGADSFRIHHVTPGRDVRVVLRTSENLATQACACAATRFNEAGLYRKVRFGPDLHLCVDVDGAKAGSYVLPISINQTVWSEVIFDVPGSAMRRADPEITIRGDHVAAYYWFYQPSAVHQR